MAAGGGARSKENKTSPIFLGYPDERVEGRATDFTTSKLGGSPDWCVLNTTNPNPVCSVCSSVQSLVSQIYAPLHNSVYHRTLYIFCCVQPSCWNDSRSWTCYRSQVRDTTSSSTPEEAVAPTKSQTLKTTDWLDDADDWGDDNDDNGNPDSLTSPSSPDSPPPQGALGGFPPGPHLQNYNLNNNEDISLRNLNIGDGDTDAGERPRKPEDAGGSLGHRQRPREGAGGSLGYGDETTAEIELDDEDQGCVSVDIPQVDTSHIPALFVSNPNSGDVPTTGVVLTSRYIWVGEEASSAPVPSQHEINLLNQLKNEGGLDGGGGGVDVYEKAVPRHGDEFTHKLVSTVQKNPGQVLRYCRGSTEPPLLFQPLDAKDLSPCKECGEPSVFELQLLPTLVSVLEAEHVEGTVVEFGTLLLYSCAASCWKEGNSVKSETVILQQENM